MADHYIGINRGNQGLAGGGRDDAITYGTSTGSTDMEVRIGDAIGWTRLELIDALEAIEKFLANPSVITGTKFPPG